MSAQAEVFIDRPYSEVGAMSRSGIASWPNVNGVLHSAATELLARNGFSDAWRLGMRGDGRGQLTLTSPSSATLGVMSSVLLKANALRWCDGCGRSWAVRVVDEDKTSWSAEAISIGVDVRLLDQVFFERLRRRVSSAVTKCQPEALTAHGHGVVERLQVIREAVRLWTRIVKRRAVMLHTGNIELDASVLGENKLLEGKLVRLATDVWSSWQFARFRIPKVGWAPQLEAFGPALLEFSAEPDPAIRLSGAFIAAWRTVVTPFTKREYQSAAH